MNASISDYVLGWYIYDGIWSSIYLNRVTVMAIINWGACYQVPQCYWGSHWEFPGWWMPEVVPWCVSTQAHSVTELPLSTSISIPLIPRKPSLDRDRASMAIQYHKYSF